MCQVQRHLQQAGPIFGVPAAPNLGARSVGEGNGTNQWVPVAGVLVAYVVAVAAGTDEVPRSLTNGKARLQEFLVHIHTAHKGTIVRRATSAQQRSYPPCCLDGALANCTELREKRGYHPTQRVACPDACGGAMEASPRVPWLKVQPTANTPANVLGEGRRVVARPQP